MRLHPLLAVIVFMSFCIVSCDKSSQTREAPNASRPGDPSPKTGNQPAAATTPLDLKALTGIAELSNMGISPAGKRLVVLGVTVPPNGGFSHEAWLIDLESKPTKAYRLQADSQSPIWQVVNRFAWSPDGLTLLTLLSDKSHFWSTRDGTEVAAPKFPAEAYPTAPALTAKFDPADRLLRACGYEPCRGWVTAFSAHGEARELIGSASMLVSFAGSSKQTGDADPRWMRFSPDGRALFWVDKDNAGTLYRITSDYTLDPAGESSPRSRLDRRKKLFAIGAHGAEVRSAAVNSTGSHVFTAGMDGCVRAWSVAERKMAGEINAIADLGIAASDLWGMELSTTASHLFIYAQPADKTQRLVPGRAWVKRLDWPPSLHAVPQDSPSPVGEIPRT